MKTIALPRTASQIQKTSLAERIMSGLSRHWLLVLNIALGIWVILPWLAPVMMHLGWTGAGNAVYFLYSFQCHQLPERSYFLFGKKMMYSLGEIQAAWQTTSDPMILRQFIGNPEMGWKVAWSDRMVSMYTSIVVGGLIYGLFRAKAKKIAFWVFALLALPIVLDGGTHILSDLAGVGQGFRDTNLWLQILTHNAFSMSFYQGDALGSFNSWMRLITGILFGLGLVGFAYPYINETFADTVHNK